MNYVIAAWLACAAILIVYSLRTVHRERALRRSLAPSRPPQAPSANRREKHRWT